MRKRQPSSYQYYFIVSGRLQGDLTSVQAVEAIVTAKQKERLKELERQKLEVAAEHDRKLQQAAEEHCALHEDNQLRKASGRWLGKQACMRSSGARF